MGEVRPSPITRLLIANRGEIAVRIARSAGDLGIETVAVYAEDDAAALHARGVSRAVALPGAGPRAYLDGERLLRVAAETGCDAVHPGYGFLSEDPAFARRCADSGLRFVGPRPDVLDLFGDKAAARAFAAMAGVPTLAGTTAVGPEEAERFLAGLGPGSSLVVKPVAGGGGRGIRVVRDAATLRAAIRECRAEARQEAVYLERYLERARHIEVQVVGDGTGAVHVLGDRDCSVQRRHQKLIEIAPAPALTPRTRHRLHEAARTLAADCRFDNLGTFEFLVDGPDCHFIEANPRLQVEHTVTEEVTGVDLVATAIRLSEGARLPDLRLPDPTIGRTSIEVRINTETVRPDGSTAGATGTLTRFDPPGLARVDSHAYAGWRVGGGYDPLLAKLIVTTDTADLAVAARRTLDALDRTAIEGIETNIGLLGAILAHPEFTKGTAGTAFLADHLADLVPATDDPPADRNVVVAPMPGTVVAVHAERDDVLARDAPIVTLEAMKMHHVVSAGTPVTLRALHVAVGDTVEQGRPLARVEPADGVEDEPDARPADPAAAGGIRPDLGEALERRRRARDEGRPATVAAWHERGRRTARENIEALCDPGSFVEYGALGLAAQRGRRGLAELIERTPADGLVCGIGTINRHSAVVMAYDYTVLAGTQGIVGHRKADRMLDLAAENGLPVVVFAEGGGGRPGDSDRGPSISGLDVTTFTRFGRLNGRVPLVGIVSGRCFAGNAALLGCCDVAIATPDATVGMGGPAVIEGAGLGTVAAGDVGPMSVQAPNGVIDVVVADEAEATSCAARYLSYFQGRTAGSGHADQRLLREAVPANRLHAYDVRALIDALADTGSVLELRRDFGGTVVTALVRVAGRPMGLIANDCARLGGAIDSDGADKAARFLQLCDAHRLPVLSLCDTPGVMVGPASERTATVRHVSRMLIAGANLTVPIYLVVLRKCYGFGALAMAGGSLTVPACVLSWPTGEFGGLGLEAAVRLGHRRELAAIGDPAERERYLNERVAELHETGRAVNVATVFEIDDVIDPAETRARILAVDDARGPRPERRRPVGSW